MMSVPQEAIDSYADGPVWGPPWMNRRHRGARARVIPMIVALALQLPTLGITLHDGKVLPSIAVVIAFLATPLLLLSRRWPGPVVVALGALTTPSIALGIGPPLQIAPLAFAVVFAILRSKRVWVWSTLAGIGLLGVIGWGALGRQGGISFRLLASVVVLSIIVGASEGVRNRAERLREVSRQIGARRQSAAEAERLRIARELHDVLAHSLSQISVQSSVGLHLFDSNPEQARESLASIKDTSKRALDEVRTVLGVLRAEGETAPQAPEPDLGRLGELAESAASAGIDVTIVGDPGVGLPAAVQLAAYRIVQESLTNVGRHSAARTARVTLERDAAWLHVTVDDPGPAVSGSDDSRGKGTIGMRERAVLLGGTLEAGATVDGGYRVGAALPVAAGTDS
jgi:signal transduction histidine kinase